MQTKTQLPKFQGKPLIEIPEYIPQVDFLSGEFGEAVYNEVADKYGDNNPFVTRDVFYDQNDEIVKGSKPGFVVAVNEFIREQGLRTATPADLERVIKTNTLDLRGQYEDSALVLRDNNEPNSYLARSLLAQIGDTLPVMIPLNNLELKADNDSPYDLFFSLRDDAEIIYNPILNKDSEHFSSEDIDENGLPKKLGKGDRYFYTRNSGLSRLYLGGYLDVDSNDGRLAYSGDYGRVVVVSAEGANENLEKYISQLKKERDKQKAEIDGRFKEAMSVLKSN